MTEDEASAAEQAKVERWMSRIFGKDRQAHSEDEKTRHVGLVFLTVKLAALFTRGPKKAVGKPPVRTTILPGVSFLAKYS